MSAAAGALMVIPAAGWQRQVSALMGTEGPSTLGYMRTLIMAAVVGGALVGVSRVLIDAVRVFARYFIRRWQVNDEVAQFIGTAIVVVLVITLVHGVLFRGFIACRPRGVRATQRQHASGHQPADTTRRSGSPRVFRPVGHPRGIRAATSSQPARVPKELTELNGRPAKGTDPDLRRDCRPPNSTEGRVAVVLTQLKNATVVTGKTVASTIMTCRS